MAIVWPLIDKETIVLLPVMTGAPPTQLASAEASMAVATMVRPLIEIVVPPTMAASAATV